MGPTGAFRPSIEEYLALDTHRAASTLANVRLGLAAFFTRMVNVEDVHDLGQVTSMMVTRFLAAERDRGMTSSNVVGYVSTFFYWRMAHDLFNGRNPVIPRVHSRKSKPAKARPYSDKDLNLIWGDTESDGGAMLMLAFAIGEECGLRIGEVANIRLEDFDTNAQRLFVRLPTKGKRTREVPYHEKVAKYLAIWLMKRDCNCGHDHVLHGKRFARLDNHEMARLFKQLLRNKCQPSSSFSFHRLRHTWATRLMNNGIDLNVLMELGGWVNLNSMQRYIKVLPDTIRRQYEAAYQRIEEVRKHPPEPTLSLLEFALLESPDGAPAITEAA
jgi:integrase